MVMPSPGIRLSRRLSRIRQASDPVVKPVWLVMSARMPVVEVASPPSSCRPRTWQWSPLVAMVIMAVPVMPVAPRRIELGPAPAMVVLGGRVMPADRW